MEHAFVVRVMHGARDLHHQRRALARMLEQGAAGLEQSAGGRVLHCVKRKTIRRFAHLIDRNNVRVLQTRGCLRFPAEARHEMIGIAFIGEDALQRHDSA